MQTIQTCIKRLKKEQERYPTLKVSYLELLSSRQARWILTVPGPPDSPWEKLPIDVEITYESTYPFHSPFIRFCHDLHHPNIHPSGQVSDLLTSHWNYSHTIQTIHDNVQHLLANPLSEYLYNPEAARAYQTDPALWATKARQTLIFLQGRGPEPHPVPHNHSETAPGHTDTDRHP